MPDVLAAGALEDQRLLPENFPAKAVGSPRKSERICGGPRPAVLVCSWKKPSRVGSQ